MKTIEQQVEEFRKDFNYAHFTWNGDNATGEMFAKKSRNKVVNAFKKALQERDRIAREEERENCLRCLDECLMMCSIHQDLQKDGSCADCSDALNANMMLYEAIKALTTPLEDKE